MNQPKENKEVFDSPYGVLPNVPLKAFPDSTRKMLLNASESFCIPLEIAVACFLALLSALVGRALQISIKDSWTEAANLWLVIVAKSGVGKTPCMQEFFRHLYTLEHKEKITYDIKYRAYEETLNARKMQASKNNNVTGNLPEKPKRKQTIVNDATIEVIGEILNENPKGIQCLVDELSGFMFDMDKYTHLKVEPKLVI